MIQAHPVANLDCHVATVLSCPFVHVFHGKPKSQVEQKKNQMIILTAFNIKATAYS
jgi:hypothetical protein